MKKITDLEHKNEPEAEKVLNQKVESGGNVMIDKDKFTKEVDVLWVQTKSMRDKQASCFWDWYKDRHLGRTV